MTCRRGNKNSETFESMGKQLAREKEGKKKATEKSIKNYRPANIA